MLPEHPPLGVEPRWFSVAFICTGNRARSPFAAELLRQHAGNLPVAVQSFGTLDLGPAPVLPKALWAAEALGVDLAPHRARPLTAGALTSADLAVGFEPFHAAAAVVTGNAERERTFLITELVPLLDAFRMSLDPTVALRSGDIIALAHTRRTERHFRPQSVADPVRGSKEDFRAAFEQVSALVAAIAIGILGDRAVRPER